MGLWSQGGYELISPGSGWNCGMVRWIRGGDEVWVEERRGGMEGRGATHYIIPLAIAAASTTTLFLCTNWDWSKDPRRLDRTKLQVVHSS